MTADFRLPPVPKAEIRRDLLALAVFAGILYFLALGARDLWNPNEPIYGRAVVEMANRGDWLIPTINDTVFAEKPILYFWGALGAAKLFGGVNEWTLRLPSAVAGVLSVLLTYLLAWPYVGRRRAALTAVLFATLYQVFWAARAIQMDVLVLASTLGVVVALTRLLDFELAPNKAWTLAGIAAGLGFAAKGPVALILPGIVVFAYAIARRKLPLLLAPGLLLGAGVAIVVSAPWYLALWLGGHTDVLHEVLIRQNFSRFADAWDHQQPWWYYLEYLWIDYAPWSWLLPAAWLTTARSAEERSLNRLSWIWIIGIIAFFSLSDSKRAPYILPIAPAVAVLAAAVVSRFATTTLGTGARRATVVAWSLLALIFTAVGVVVPLRLDEAPAELRTVAIVLALILGLTGLVTATGLIIARKRPRLAPAALFTGMATFYLVASAWALPALDPLKSARHFAANANHLVLRDGGALASFRLWDWRAGYAFYAHTVIPNLKERSEIEAFWYGDKKPFFIVEAPRQDELRAWFPDAELVYEREIGNREAMLFSRAAPGPSSPPPAAAVSTVAEP